MNIIHPTQKVDVKPVKISQNCAPNICIIIIAIRERESYVDSSKEII